MDWKTARRGFRASICLFLFLIPRLAPAQTTATLSGSVTDTAGKAIPNATVTARKDATGQSEATKTNSAGSYTLPNLALGDYTVSVTAEGFTAQQSKVSLV